MTNTIQKFIEEMDREFDEKFAKIVHIHRGECAITDITGTRFEAHTENGLVTEIGSLESVKDFHHSTLIQFCEVLELEAEKLIGSKSSDYNKGVQDVINLLKKQHGN